MFLHLAIFMPFFISFFFLQWKWRYTNKILLVQLGSLCPISGDESVDTISSQIYSPTAFLFDELRLQPHVAVHYRFQVPLQKDIYRTCKMVKVTTTLLSWSYCVCGRRSSSSLSYYSPSSSSSSSRVLAARMQPSSGHAQRFVWQVFCLVDVAIDRCHEPHLFIRSMGFAFVLGTI